MDKKIVYRWAMVTNVMFAVMLFLPTFTNQSYYSLSFYLVLLLGIGSNGVLVVHSNDKYKPKNH